MLSVIEKFGDNNLFCGTDIKHEKKINKDVSKLCLLYLINNNISKNDIIPIKTINVVIDA